MSKISGPIRDRIDLVVTAEKIQVEELMKKVRGIDSAAMREQVMTARRMQEKRFQGKKYQFNAQIPTREIKKYCALGKEEELFMEQVYHTLDLSARAFHKILKVARTIADLEEAEQIRVGHLSEAVCYRSQDEI